MRARARVCVRLGCTAGGMLRLRLALLALSRQACWSKCTRNGVIIIDVHVSIKEEK